MTERRSNGWRWLDEPACGAIRVFGLAVGRGEPCPRCGGQEVHVLGSGACVRTDGVVAKGGWRCERARRHKGWHSCDNASWEG